MNENPDAVPEVGSGNAGSVPADISLTPAAQQLLDQTRPWIRFMSVMIFISAAFLAVVGVLMVLLGLGPRIASPGPGRFGSLGPLGNVATGLFDVFLAIVYLAPGVFLSRYASAIRLLQTSRSTQVLEDAFRNQKFFWRYVGILTIICLVLGAILIAFGILAAILFLRRSSGTIW